MSISFFFSLSVTLLCFSHPATTASFIHRASGIEQKQADSNAVTAVAPVGNTSIRLQPPRTLPASYEATAELRAALENNLAQPRALAAADFDQDGVLDLISGYEYQNRGIVTVSRGNIESAYPNSPEAQLRLSNGKSTNSSFLWPARAIPVPVPVHLIGAGDFDGDGHGDIVTASRSGGPLYLLSGDGQGGFAAPSPIALPGAVTAMVTGDLNRSDGLTDLVLGISGPGGSQVMVFEGPEGALRSSPEVFAAPAGTISVVTGHLDADRQLDLAVAAGRELLYISGRDRKLSLNEKSRAGVPSAILHRRAFGYAIKSIASGNFSGSGTSELALLADSGDVHILSREVSDLRKHSRLDSLQSWTDQVSIARWAIASHLLTARTSSQPFD